MSAATRPPGELLDYRSYITRQVNAARGRVKAVDVFTGLWIIAVGGISYILAVMVLDQLLTLSNAARVFLFLGFAAGTAAFLAYAVVLPAVRKVNLLYAARELEKADPNTKNSVVNFLQLAEREDAIPEAIFEAIEKRAANDLRNIDPRDAIQSRHAIHAAYFLAAVVVVFCGFWVFSTKDLGPTFQRVVFPFQEIKPPTNTRLVDMQPGSLVGDNAIPAGETVAFTAYATGKRPESVDVYISADNGAFWEPIGLAPPREPFGQWSAKLPDRQRDFDYYFVANDFRSDTYRVEVTAAPAVTDYKVSYTFPAYLQEPPRTEAGGDIRAVEGTVARVEVTTNRPVADGDNRLVVKLGNNAPLTVPMTKLPGSTNQLFGDIKLTEDGNYSVDFRDLSGRRPQTRVFKSIRVEKDTAPTVEFTEPKEKDSKAPANAELLFVLDAFDQFGLRDVKLFVQRVDDKRRPLDKTWGGNGIRLGTSQHLVQTLDLANCKLPNGDAVAFEAGDRLEYWAEANDVKTPVNGFAKTEIRFIELTAPISKDDKQKQQQNNERANKKQNNQPNREQNQNNEEQPKPENSQQQEEGEGSSEQPKDKSGDAQPKDADASKGDGKSGESKQGTNKGDDNGTNQEEKPLSEDDRKNLDKLDKLLNQDRPKGARDSKPKKKDETGSEPENQPKDGNGSESKSKEGKRNEEKSGDDANQNQSHDQKSSDKENQSKKGGKADPKQEGKPDNESREGADQSTGDKNDPSNDKQPANSKDAKQDGKAGHDADRAQESSSSDKAAKKEPKEETRKSNDRNDAQHQAEGQTAKDRAKQKDRTKDKIDQSNSGDAAEKEAEGKDDGANPKSKDTSAKGKSKDDKAKKAEADEDKSSAKAKEDSKGNQAEGKKQETQKDAEQKAMSAGGNDRSKPKNDAGDNQAKSQPQGNADSTGQDAGAEGKKDANEKSGDADAKSGVDKSDSTKKEKGESGGEKGKSESGDQSKDQQGNRPGKEESSPGGEEKSGSEKSGNKKDGGEKRSDKKDTAEKRGDQKEGGDSKSGEQNSPGGSENKSGQAEDSDEGKQKGAGEKQEKGQPKDKPKGESSPPKKAAEKGDGASENENSDAKKESSKEGDEKGKSAGESKPQDKTGKGSDQAKKGDNEDKQSSDEPAKPSGKKVSDEDKSESPNAMKKDGENTKVDQGSGKNDAAGDKKGKGGEQKGEGAQKGQDGKQQGQGQQKGDSKQAGNSGSDDKPGDDKGGASGKEASKQSEQQGKGGQGKQSKASDKKSIDKAPKEGGGNTPGGGRESNPAGDAQLIDNTGKDGVDRDKATELVLKRLEDELKKKKPDPELLKKLGMTEGELKKFADRLRDHVQAKEKAADPLSGKQRRDFAAKAKILSNAARKAGTTKQDQNRDLFQDRRIAPPSEYKDRFEDYTKSLSESDPRSSIPKPPKGK